MKKRFNSTGVCVSRKHYMVDISNKLEQIRKLIDIEMKIWRGLKYHEDGIKQLCGYLDIHDLDKGYLLVFNFSKNKEFKEERATIEGKDIFQVYV